jgi:hypothetical protein
LPYGRRSGEDSVDREADCGPRSQRKGHQHDEQRTQSNALADHPGLCGRLGRLDVGLKLGGGQVFHRRNASEASLGGSPVSVGVQPVNVWREEGEAAFAGTCGRI